MPEGQHFYSGIIIYHLIFAMKIRMGYISCCGKKNQKDPLCAGAGGGFDAQFNLVTVSHITGLRQGKSKVVKAKE